MTSGSGLSDFSLMKRSSDCAFPPPLMYSMSRIALMPGGSARWPCAAGRVCADALVTNIKTIAAKNFLIINLQNCNAQPAQKFSPVADASVLVERSPQDFLLE